MLFLLEADAFIGILTSKPEHAVCEMKLLVRSAVIEIEKENFMRKSRFYLVREDRDNITLFQL